MHHTTCEKVNCKCNTINLELSQEEKEIPQLDNQTNEISALVGNSSFLLLNPRPNQLQHDEAETKGIDLEKESTNLYSLLIELVDDSEHMEISPSPLLLEKAYIQGIYLEHREKSLYTLAKLRDLHQNLYLQSLIFSFKYYLYIYIYIVTRQGMHLRIN